MSLEPLPLPVRAACAAVLGYRIYVTGGQTVTECTRGVEVYDTHGGTWRSGPALPAARFNQSTVALGGTLYVFGVFDSSRERRDVFEWRPGERSWRRVAPLPRPLHAFGAVAFHCELWTISGRRGQQILREVWI